MKLDDRGARFSGWGDRAEDIGEPVVVAMRIERDRAVLPNAALTVFMGAFR